MSSLAEFQRAFASAVRDPSVSPPRQVRGIGSTAAGARFDVYRNNVAVSLTEALKSTYPAVCRLAGESAFEMLARAYIDRHPPRSPVLLTYGGSFGEFLDDAPVSARMPYLGDVARLERACIDALHASDAGAIPLSSLGKIEPSRLDAVMLGLHPAFALVRSDWPVVSLWRTDASGTAAESDLAAPEDAVVVRPRLRVGVYVLPARGAAFLEALGTGRTLAEAAARAGVHGESELAGLLRFVFEIGAVTSVDVPPSGNSSP